VAHLPDSGWSFRRTTYPTALNNTRRNTTADGQRRLDFQSETYLRATGIIAYNYVQSMMAYFGRNTTNPNDRTR
jgi:hypothetical protein